MNISTNSGRPLSPFLLSVWVRAGSVGREEPLGKFSAESSQDASPRTVTAVRKVDPIVKVSCLFVIC